MKIRFAGLENAVVLEPGYATVLELTPKKLFARVCQSLVSEQGVYAAEGYSLWEAAGKELNPRGAFLPVLDVLHLPWDHRVFSGKLFESMQAAFLEDEGLRMKLEEHNREIASAIATLGLQMNAAYGFELEWSLPQYLKSFRYQVDQSPDGTLLDSLIDFLNYCADMRVSRPLLFVNLKNFLGEDELVSLYEQVFFHKMKVLMLENSGDETEYEYERKYHVDQHFLESQPVSLSIPPQ